MTEGGIIDPSWRPPDERPAPPNGPGPSRRSFLLGVVAVGLLAVAAGGVGWWTLRSDGQGFVQEPASEVGADPWQKVDRPVPEELEDALQDIREAVADSTSDFDNNGISSESPDYATAHEAAVAAARAQGLDVIGPATPMGVGLYGGTTENACDIEALKGFLAANPGAAAAWVSVQPGLEIDDIPAFIDSLHAGFLLIDTRVVNHGFRNGRANPIPNTVLAAGSAVLVDDNSIPRVRCSCGNPLLPDTSAIQTAAFERPPELVDGSFPVQMRLSVDQFENPQLFPLGVPGDATITLSPGEIVEDGPDFPSGTASILRRYEVDIDVGTGTRSLGEVILPDSYERDFLVAQGASEATVGVLRTQSDGLAAGLGAAAYCFEENRPRNTVGGWRYTDGPADVEVFFAVTTSGGEVTAHQVALVLDGEAARVDLRDSTDNVDLSNCAAIDRLVLTWIT